MPTHRSRRRIALAYPFALAIAAPTLAQEAIQWRVEDGGNGHWYLLRTRQSTMWSTEQELATSIGAHLATITTADERSFLQARFAVSPGGGNAAFVGLFQDPSASDFAEPAGGWRWITGEPLTLWPFCPGEPNNAAGGQDWGRAYISSDGWCVDDWRPGTCCTPCCSLLEWSVDCNGDGLVDYGQLLDGTLADANGNGVPDCCEPSPADLNGDGTVNADDIALLLGNWGPTVPKTVAFDLDADGLIDANDLGIVLASWGACP